MSLIYITGPSATGKSTIRVELLKRGYIALGGSEDGLTGFYNKETMRHVPNQVAVRNKPGWLTKHSWILPRSTVLNLCQRAHDGITFVCTSAANDREIWQYFDRVILLVLDVATQQQRLRLRTNNDWGKTPMEQEYILRDQNLHDKLYSELPLTRLDANRPVTLIVDDILQQVLYTSS